MDNFFSSIKSILEEISSNTHPLEFIYGNLGYWSFGVAIFSSIIAIISVRIAYLAYHYQKKASEYLGKIVPGQMIFDEIVCNLQTTYLNIEAIFFGDKTYKEYPVPLIFSSAKLPEDIIVLAHYENTKQCYDEALKLKMAWREYNVYVEKLIDYSSNSDVQIVLNFAKIMLSLTKNQILSLNKFNKILREEHLIKDTVGTDQKLAWFLINRFFEYIQLIDESVDLDTKRGNITKKTKDMHLLNSLIPQTVDFKDYLKSNPYFCLVEDETNDSYTNDLKTENIIKDIRKGEYDFLGNYLYRELESISKIEISNNFHEIYFSYMEPIILGYLRYEYYQILHPQNDDAKKVTRNENAVPDNSTKGKKKKTKGKAGKKK